MVLDAYTRVVDLVFADAEVSETSTSVKKRFREHMITNFDMELAKLHRIPPSYVCDDIRTKAMQFALERIGRDSLRRMDVLEMNIILKGAITIIGMYMKELSSIARKNVND